MATMNDVPMPRFITPVFNDDEYAIDPDIEAMRRETYSSPFVEWLNRIAA